MLFSLAIVARLGVSFLKTLARRKDSTVSPLCSLFSLRSIALSTPSLFFFVFHPSFRTERSLSEHSGRAPSKLLRVQASAFLAACAAQAVTPNPAGLALSASVLFSFFHCRSRVVPLGDFFRSILVFPNLPFRRSQLCPCWQDSIRAGSPSLSSSPLRRLRWFLHRELLPSREMLLRSARGNIFALGCPRIFRGGRVN